MKRDEKQELKTKVREAADGESMGRNEQMRTVSVACSACRSPWGIIWPERSNTHLTSHPTGGSTRGISHRQAGAYLNSEREYPGSYSHSGSVIDSDR